MTLACHFSLSIQISKDLCGLWDMWLHVERGGKRRDCSVVIQTHMGRLSPRVWGYGVQLVALAKLVAFRLLQVWYQIQAQSGAHM